MSKRGFDHFLRLLLVEIELSGKVTCCMQRTKGNARFIAVVARTRYVSTRSIFIHDHHEGGGTNTQYRLGQHRQGSDYANDSTPQMRIRRYLVLLHDCTHRHRTVSRQESSSGDEMDLTDSEQMVTNVGEPGNDPEAADDSPRDLQSAATGT